MHRRTFSRKTLGIPYAIFLLLFVAMPLLVLVYYAFTNGQGEFTVMNLVGFFTNPNTLGTLFYSFGVAIVTTVVCLLLAYPTAAWLHSPTALPFDGSPTEHLPAKSLH